MKTFNNILMLGWMLFLFAACEEEATLTRLAAVSFPGTLQPTTSEITITAENMEETVISLSWQKVTYPVDAPVTYTLQVAMPADTIGATAWQNAPEKEFGDDVLSGILTGAQLNEMALDAGLEPEVEGTLVVRVKAYLDREVYSKAIAIQVTPYKPFTSYPALWVAGDFQGWNVTTAPTIVSVKDDGVYEGYLYIPAGGTNEFKLYAQPNWEPTSYGDGGEGTVIVANYAVANFQAPSDGYYLFSVNLNNMTYLLIKTTWGIIGGATPGGWGSDTQMTYNAGAQTWTVTADMIADGSFKFRANNAWQLDFGIDGTGKLAYANHPWLPYIDQPQLTVPTNGNYTLTLDLHEPGNYKYNIKKN